MIFAEIVKNKYNGICLKNEIKNLPFYFNYLMNKGNRNSIIKNAHKTLKTSFTNNKMFKNTIKSIGLINVWIIRIY